MGIRAVSLPFPQLSPSLRKRLPALFSRFFCCSSQHLQNPFILRHLGFSTFGIIYQLPTPGDEGLKLSLLPFNMHMGPPDPPLSIRMSHDLDQRQWVMGHCSHCCSSKSLLRYRECGPAVASVGFRAALELKPCSPGKPSPDPELWGWYAPEPVLPNMGLLKWAVFALGPLIGLAKTFPDLHWSPVASLPSSAFLPFISPRCYSSTHFCAHSLLVAAPWRT